MLMCEDCFTLFEPYTKLEYCPIRGCEGELVNIDDVIAPLISDLNRKLEEESYPIRTNFCCSGHDISNQQPYVGFRVYVDNEDELNIFLENFLTKVRPALDRLNCNISQIKHLKIIDLFKIYPDTLSFLVEECKPEYRIFINGFHFNYESEDSYSRWMTVFQIQAFFQQFLLDLIYSL